MMDQRLVSQGLSLPDSLFRGIEHELGDHGSRDLPAPGHIQTHLPHEALDSAACDLPPLVLQAVPDPAHTINSAVILPDPTDMLHQIPITLCTYAGPGRISCYGRLMIKRGRGNQQNAIICETGGRAPPVQNKPKPSSGSHWPDAVHEPHAPMS